MSFQIYNHEALKTEIDDMDQIHIYSIDDMSIHSTSVTYACTSATSDNSSLHAPWFSDRVQAWPTPLTGAGLFQNLHQIVAAVTVYSVEPVHEDE